LNEIVQVEPLCVEVCPMCRLQWGARLCDSKKKKKKKKQYGMVMGAVFTAVCTTVYMVTANSPIQYLQGR
jgi:hypothetical protein